MCRFWGRGSGAQSSACDFSARCGAQQFACDSARGSWGARAVAYAFQYMNSGSRTRYVILGARGFHVQVWGAGFGLCLSMCGLRHTDFAVYPPGTITTMVSEVIDQRRRRNGNALFQAKPDFQTRQPYSRNRAEHSGCFRILIFMDICLRKPKRFACSAKQGKFFSNRQIAHCLKSSEVLGAFKIYSRMNRPSAFIHKRFSAVRFFCSFHPLHNTLFKKTAEGRSFGERFPFGYSQKNRMHRN